MRFVDYRSVGLSGFFGNIQERVANVTIPYQWDALNDRVPGADKSGAVKNLRIAADMSQGNFHGFVFQDSDVAKWIEAVAYSIGLARTKTGVETSAMERAADRLIGLIEAAQDVDGYLNSAFTIKDRDKRWTDLRDNHEMYVAGHMLEAAIAYYEATGKRRLLDVMDRNIDHIESRFGRSGGKTRGYPGHPELELALVRMHRLTGQRKHLDLASYFIDERGRKPRYFDREARTLSKEDFRGFDWYAIYNQSYAPIREHREVVGHAVRACYLYAAAADVALETDDRDLFNVVKGLWSNATERRMYLTGGVGSTLLGEAFTFDYDLPNEWAYTETCAAIALAIWGRRMLLHETDARYGDVIERALYNNILASISLDGMHCFYRNPLASKPDPKYPKRHERRPWHECACCPPNLSRFLMSLGGYAYSVSENRHPVVHAHLFLASSTRIKVGTRLLEIRQRTNYPWEGSVMFDFGLEQAARFTFAFRIPGWSRTFSVAVNGEKIDLSGSTQAGYGLIKRTWSGGDTVEIEFPMPAERVRAHGSVRQDAGRVALQRGPIVYCLEEADNGPDLHEIVLLPESDLEVREAGGKLGSHRIIESAAIRKMVDTGGALYASDVLRSESNMTLRAIPYYLWSNRGMAEMTVWMREAHCPVRLDKDHARGSDLDLGR